MDAQAFFAGSYRRARTAFLAAAEAAGATLHEHRHPLTGAEGETLALDVARLGPRDARAVLLLSSACHGVEGHAGSAIQLALLHDAAALAAAREAGVALVLLHALNPWGFSWGRRSTHENVDLNRNAQDFHAPLPANPGYEALAHRLVPPHHPPGWRDSAALLAHALRHGRRALQAAISAGQHSHPEGLFYGGVAPTWSLQALRHALADEAGRCAHLAWVDLHTGLGPCGHGERILAAAPGDAAAAARARAWWGPRLTSVFDGSSSSARLTGMVYALVPEACPQAQATGLALEFGTVPPWRVLQALRRDQWFENHPEAPAAAAAAARRAVRDAFFVDTPTWRAAVLQQGLEVVRQGVAGLRAGMS